MLATHFGHIEVVRILLAHNAHLDYQSYDYQHTALHLACKGHRFEVVAMLIEHGANAFITDAQGRSCFDLIGIRRTRDALLEYAPWMRRRHMVLFVRGCFMTRGRRRNSRTPSARVLADPRLVNRILSHM